MECEMFGMIDEILGDLQGPVLILGDLQGLVLIWVTFGAL